MNSPPTRYCKRNSRKSFSVSEGEPGEMGGGWSCTETVYTLFASKPDIVEGLPRKVLKVVVRVQMRV